MYFNIHKIDFNQHCFTYLEFRARKDNRKYFYFIFFKEPDKELGKSEVEDKRIFTKKMYCNVFSLGCKFHDYWIEHFKRIILLQKYEKETSLKSL